MKKVGMARSHAHFFKPVRAFTQPKALGALVGGGGHGNANFREDDADVG